MEAPPEELLRVLVAMAETKNLMEAARKLSITQPAVSQRLRRLEALVPLPLFQREGKRKRLTPYGHRLYEMGKENRTALTLAFENLNRAYADAKNLTLRVGCRPQHLALVLDRIQFAGRIEHFPLSGHDSILKICNLHQSDTLIFNLVKYASRFVCKS